MKTVIPQEHRRIMKLIKDFNVISIRQVSDICKNSGVSAKSIVSAFRKMGGIRLLDGKYLVSVFENNIDNKYLMDLDVVIDMIKPDNEQSVLNTTAFKTLSKSDVPADMMFTNNHDTSFYILNVSKDNLMDISILDGAIKQIEELEVNRQKYNPMKRKIVFVTDSEEVAHIIADIELSTEICIALIQYTEDEIPNIKYYTLN